MVNIKEYSLTKIKHWFAKIFTGDDILTIYICSERERNRERERERECVCVCQEIAHTVAPTMRERIVSIAKTVQGMVFNRQASRLRLTSSCALPSWEWGREGGQEKGG